MSLSNRRTFLQASSTAAAAAALGAVASRSSFAGAPSDKVRVGLIGCGGRGKHDAGLFQSSPNVEIAYVWDCDQGRLAESAKLFGVPSTGVISDIQKRGSIGRGQDTSPPAGFDYESWVGPATMVPYRTNRVHNRWTWWYHFGTGDMGNDGVHDIDYTRWGLGVETHPSKIVALGGKYFFDDDQQFPDTQQVTFEYPGDGKAGSQRLLIYEQRLWSTSYPYNVDSGAEFYGTDGQMFLSRRGKVEIRNGRNVKVDVDIKPEPQNDVAHVRNFCEAIRGGAKLNADALTGHLTSSLCHLGNIATRLAGPWSSIRTPSKSWGTT